MSRQTETIPTSDGESQTSHPSIVVLTGPREAGKTSACHRLATLATARGWTVAGVLSPAVFQGGRKVGISLFDLSSGLSRHFASRLQRPDPSGLGYCFEEAAISWANDVLSSAPPCDLLVVDEVGPLEILYGKGIATAFGVLRQGRYRLAVIVVRPELIDAFQARLGVPCRVENVQTLAIEDLLDEPGDLNAAEK